MLKSKLKTLKRNLKIYLGVEKKQKLGTLFRSDYLIAKENRSTHLLYKENALQTKKSKTELYA